MAITTGSCEYLWIGSSTTPFGIVTGGSFKEAEAPEHRTGIGGVDNVVGKLYVPTLSVDFLPINTTIPSIACRSALCTPLTGYTVGFGVGGTEYQVLGCKANSLKLGVSVGDPLSCSLELQGTSATTSTYSVPTQSIGNHYEWYRSVVTVEGSCYAAQSVSVSLDNSLSALSNLCSKSAGAKRFPTSIQEGSETVTVEVTTHEPISLSTLGVWDDDIVTSIDLSAVMTKVGGSGTFTIAVSNLACTDASVPVEVEGVIEYKYSFTAPTNSLSLSIS